MGSDFYPVRSKPCPRCQVELGHDFCNCGRTPERESGFKYSGIDDAIIVSQNELSREEPVTTEQLIASMRIEDPEFDAAMRASELSDRVTEHRAKRAEQYGPDRNASEVSSADHLRTHDGWDLVEGLRREVDDLRVVNQRLCADLLTVIGHRDEFRDRAEGITAHFRATHAERENAEMTAWVQRWAPIIEAAKDVCLDHSCGLEGWDESCPECRLAKLMYEETGR